MEEKSVLLHERWIRPPNDHYWNTYEHRMSNLKTQQWFLQTAIDLRDELCIRNKPQTEPLPQNPLEYNSVELYITLNEHLIKKYMDKTENATSGARNC
jgi:hypothetical protein